MKMIRFVCHDGVPDTLPLIVTFTVDDKTETEDIIETFGKALNRFIPGSEDCPPIRYAADKVCREYNASVDACEADQEFGVPVHDQAICSECRAPLAEGHDHTSPCSYNSGFANEAETCWACHTVMLESGRLTQCESCHEYFTYIHLIPNKDTNNVEICPYCGEIWCE